MPDLTLTRSGELDLTMVVGDTDAGIEFVDAWCKGEFTVIDAGVIFVRATEALIVDAAEAGLAIEYDVIATEKR